jgi:GAF domain-containing protein
MARYLDTVIRVTRLIRAPKTADDLVGEFANVLCDQLDLYHVGVYVIDAGGEWAVLEASAGKSSSYLVPPGYRVSTQEEPVIARCLLEREAQILGEAKDLQAWPLGPLLPDAKSAILVPMCLGDSVRGVLVAYSDVAHALDQAGAPALRAIGDQVALAVAYTERAGQMTDQEHMSRAPVDGEAGTAWTQLLQTRKDWGYRFADGLVQPTEGSGPPEMEAALASGETVLPLGAPQKQEGLAAAGTLAIPLRVRDETVGVLGFRKRGPQPWTDREVEVLELLAVQLGDALVSAQLYGAAQEGATRQRLVTELARRMRQTLDVESVLRTAAQEMRSALGIPEAVVRLQRAGGLSKGTGRQDGTGDDGSMRRQRSGETER